MPHRDRPFYYQSLELIPPGETVPPSILATEHGEGLNR